MAAPILGPRSRIPTAKADTLLKCYAQRLSPATAARRAQLSLNTAYDQYVRIRWRLIGVGYYRDAARSKDEDGLGQEVKRELRRRRGLEPDDVMLTLPRPSNGLRNGRQGLSCGTCEKSSL